MFIDCEDSRPNEIIALPAGDDSEDEVFIGYESKAHPKTVIQWKEAIFLSIAISCHDELKLALLRKRYGRKLAAKIIASFIGGSAGGLSIGGIGAVTGGLMGLIGGPIGALIGAAVGGAAGVAVGGAAGGTGTVLAVKDM